MRTLRNIRKVGIRDFLHQIQNIGDTKAGTYIASDRYGNKYYENVEQELPCILCISTVAREALLIVGIVRTRWVDYKDSEYNPWVPPSVSRSASLPSKI